MDSRSGIRGVSYETASNRWQARVRVLGKTVYLGRFETAEDAAQARERARIAYIAAGLL
jgi:hypothetical protein